jgi:hypothetical protein
VRTKETLTPKDIAAILNDASSTVATAKVRNKSIDISTKGATVIVAGKSEPTAADVKRSLDQVAQLMIAADPDCWLDVWESKDKGDKHERFWGPAAYPSLGDWGDEIDSLVTGPKCWPVLWEDEGFSDTHLPLYPTTYIGNLDDYNFSDQADSMKLYNQKSVYHP